LTHAFDAAALKALVDALGDVVGQEHFEVGDLLHTKPTKRSANDVRRKTEDYMPMKKIEKREER
jgi:hypothetical protein